MKRFSLILVLQLVLAAAAAAQPDDLLWSRSADVAMTGAVRFSPDSRRLLAGSVDGMLRIWDPASGDQLAYFNAGVGSVTAIEFTPDGRRFAVAGRSGTVGLFDLERLQGIRTFVGSAAANDLAIAPNGVFLVVPYDDFTVKVWDMATGAVRDTLHGHTDSVNVVAISPDSRTIASGSDDQSFIVWNAESGENLKRIFPAIAPVSEVAFREDGSRLAAGIGHYHVVEYRLDTWQIFSTANSHPLTIESIDYAPADRFLASAARDFDENEPTDAATVIVSDLSGAKPAARFAREFANGYAVAVDFSSDGRYLAWGTSRGQVEVVERAAEEAPTIFLPGRRLLTGHNMSIDAAAFRPGDRLLATADAGGTVNLWRGGDGALIGRLTGNADGVTSLDFTRDGRSLASSGIDGTVRIWNVETRHLQRTIVISAEWALSAVAFSPDGRRILASVGFGEDFVAIWDTARAELLQRFTGHEGPVTAVAWIDEGRQVVTACEDGKIRIWNAGSGALESILVESNRPWYTLALSADGRTLAAGSYDGSIRLWAMPSGDPIVALDGHDTPIRSLALSRDGALVVSAGEDQEARLWDVNSRQMLRRYASGPLEHTAVAIDSDSGRVAVGDEVGNLNVWTLNQTSSVPTTGGPSVDLPLLSWRASVDEPLALTLSLPSASPVDLELFDLLGRQVARYSSARLARGTFTVIADGEPIGSGIYVYRIVTSFGVASGTLVR